MTDDLQFSVSAREIYDAVVGLRGDVQKMSESLSGIDDRFADHESRLRGLEKWRYGLPLASATGLITGVIALLKGSGTL